jgi:heme/copper-type cytochrome/quinol oxidase subunit 2
MILANLPFMPERASTIAHEIDAIYLFTVALSTVVSILIVAAIIGFIIKFRRKRADQIGHRETAGDWLEITWTVIPTITRRATGRSTTCTCRWDARSSWSSRRRT